MLAKAQTAMGQRTTLKNINPKSISCNEFYGYIQLSTREWKDGIFSSTLRDLAALPDSNPKYLILDGDLDTNWIESMNSVMDDNKLLTLASNERINLKPHMRIIFEVRDLRFASPATVSRRESYMLLKPNSGEATLKVGLPSERTICLIARLIFCLYSISLFPNL